MQKKTKLEDAGNRNMSEEKGRPEAEAVIAPIIGLLYGGEGGAHGGAAGDDDDEDEYEDDDNL